MNRYSFFIHVSARLEQYKSGSKKKTRPELPFLTGFALAPESSMPVEDLAFSMINRKGLTLKMELRGYMNISHPGTHISKPGYLKQRMKLNPTAFVDLFKFHNRNFYSDPDAELYTLKGFLVLAVDGSDINIPTTQETLDLYGNASKRGGKPCAQIGLGCLYDTLNRMIIEADINPARFNEMAVAESQIAKLHETIGEIPYMVTMDRGYPSIPAFLRMIDAGIYFVVRLNHQISRRNSRHYLQMMRMLKSHLLQADAIITWELQMKRLSRTVMFFRCVWYVSG